MSQAKGGAGHTGAHSEQAVRPPPPTEMGLGCGTGWPGSCLPAELWRSTHRSPLEMGGAACRQLWKKTFLWC